MTAAELSESFSRGRSSAVHPVSHHAGASSFWGDSGEWAAADQPRSQFFLHALFARKERFLMKFCTMTDNSVLSLSLSLALGCRFEAAVTSLKLRINKLGGAERRKQKKMRRISLVNVAVMNNILQVLKIESMRIQQLPSNVPQFNLYYWKRISMFLMRIKSFILKWLCFCSSRRCICRLKRKYPPLLLQKWHPRSVIHRRLCRKDREITPWMKPCTSAADVCRLLRHLKAKQATSRPSRRREAARRRGEGLEESTDKENTTAAFHITTLGCV